VKRCTQCGQTLGDETKFCFKCGGANFEAVSDAGSYQQPPQPSQPQQSYYQHAPQPSQPAYNNAYYQQPSGGSSETVSVGMNFLFLFLAGIPLVGLIYAIVIAASSQKRSYKNLGIAWLILFAVQVVMAVIAYFTLRQLLADLISNFGGIMNGLNIFPYTY
jgi:heme A synthase